MHLELRQAYDREMHAAAEHYSGNNLDKAFSHLARAYPVPIVRVRACEHALVDVEGRLETPGPNRDKRSSSEDYRCVAIFTNLGAVGEYRWCVCSSV